MNPFRVVTKRFSPCYRRIQANKRANLSKAIDVIVVKQKDDSLKSTPFFVRFGRRATLKPNAKLVNLYVNNQLISDIVMRLDKSGNGHFIGKRKLESSNLLDYGTDELAIAKVSKQQPIHRASFLRKAFSKFLPGLKTGDESKSLFAEQDQAVRLSNRTLDNEHLALLNLKPGLNRLKYTIKTLRGVRCVTSNIFLWDHTDKIIITDIQSALKSLKREIRGLFTSGKSQYAKLAQLYRSIEQNGYKVIYVSRRPFVPCSLTRRILKILRINRTCMPAGPLVVNPGKLLNELPGERMHEFKLVCLSEVKALFDSAHSNPFYAGLTDKGKNKATFRELGIEDFRSFCIQTKGLKNQEISQQISVKTLVNNVDFYFPSVSKLKAEFQ